MVRIGEVAATIILQKKEKTPSPASSSVHKTVAPQEKTSASAPVFPPAVKKMIQDNKIDPSLINGTGRNNQITKGDVVNYLEKNLPQSSHSTPAPAFQPMDTTKKLTDIKEAEEVVPMSRLRQVIARRLVDVQKTAAILTTFNEVDMKAIIDLRKEHQEAFVEKYGVKLGFMSMFTAATINALKAFPAVNAEIREMNIIYKNYYHIGIAVGGPKGLVVPVLRHADRLSLAEIELAIAKFAAQVKNASIGVNDLEGGTFTISNGGVYGSMLSTPILNPPQTGILGMHNIVERPTVVNGEIVVRPIMYVALSYDHRIIDGKEAVQFLVKVKEAIENPIRLLLKV